MTVTWLLATVRGDNKIDNSIKCRKIASDFDNNGNALVQSRAHCPLKHIKGFTRSHWMLQLGKCLCRIAPVAAMVAIMVENTKH
jgi:hypothetical protein